jgi:hypothetical protein
VSRLLCADALAVQLFAEIAAGERIVEGDPTAFVKEFDGQVGVWEMTEGAARDTETDEVFVVLSGQGTVAFDDGEIIELQPGTVVRLEAGDRSLWTIRKKLRKVYLSP